MGCSGQIGIVLNLTPTYCRNPEDERDRKAAYAADLFFNRSFLDPSVKGEYPADLVRILEENQAVPVHTEQELETIRRNTVDYLGVNYYHPRRVVHRSRPLESDTFMPDRYFEYYTPENCRMNKSRGWEIYEKGLYDIGINIRDHYGNIPWMVTENGMGVQDEERFLNEEGMVEDGYRVEFIKDHLRWLHKAIEEGCNCFGYHMWCPFDSWSWSNAYKNRYGFIRIDINDHARPSFKRSAAWFRQVSDGNRFTD